MPDDREADLNAYPEPKWLEEIARRARRGLEQYKVPSVIGHGDWCAQNIWWADGRLVAVHDWDSIVSQPEAIIVGAAANIFPAEGVPLMAPLDETAEFLASYENARGEPWTDDERQICWAAGLWISAFDAKNELLHGDRRILERLAKEADERLSLAGA